MNLCFWAVLENFPYYILIMLHCAQLRFIMLLKFIKVLLPDSEDTQDYVHQRT